MDSARQTHQLFSKILIGQAIPKTLIYWAPELINLERYGTPSDMWSLGVTIYQVREFPKIGFNHSCLKVITGEHPFNVTSEEKFRRDVNTANVNWTRFKGKNLALDQSYLTINKGQPHMKTLIENLLRVAPEKRWNALEVLVFCQNDFAKEIQRAWRGFMTRKEFKRMCKALVKIQAMIKGWITRIRYNRDRILVRENAATMLQKKFRSYLTSKSYRDARRAMMRCQANVLTRQISRAYQKMRLDVMMAQAFIRRYLAIKWFKQIKNQKSELENHMESINELIMKYNMDAQDFKQKFSSKTISGPLRYLESFENYELTKAKTFGAQKTNIPESSVLHTEYQKLQEEKNMLMNRLSVDKSLRVSKAPMLMNNEYEEEELKKTLGEKYSDFKPMVDEVKKSLKRVADLVQKSYALDIRMQHPYQYR